MYQISPSPQLEYKSLMARVPHRCSIVIVTANMVEQVTHSYSSSRIYSFDNISINNHTNLFGGTFKISSMCLFQVQL